MVFEALRKVLDAQPWEELHDRLTRYTVKKLRVRYWQGELGGTPPGGKEASDFAMEAIGKVYSGERRWDPEKHPKLFGFLCDVVDSLVYDAKKSPENQRTHHIEEATERIAVPQSACAPDDFVLGFCEFVTDDPELLPIVEAILEGCMKPDDIAARLGVDPETIYKRKKRLQRKLIEFHTLVYRARRL